MAKKGGAKKGTTRATSGSTRAATAKPAWASVGDPMVGIFLLVTAFYLGLVFPLCFFRHDDWWILGNSVLYLPQDWNFLWRPSLYHSGHELVWFFRPFFKLITYVFFEAFHFQYYFWVLALLVLFFATLYTGYVSLREFTGDVAARTFVLFFTAAVPLHLGSLAWAGEGLMNVPQGLLLMVCTASWLKLLRLNKFTVRPEWVLGLAVFALAIGFKESTIFHLGLLGGLVLSELSWRQSRRQLAWLGYGAPFALLAAGYLWIRLGYMPWNPSYKPEFSATLWSVSLIKFLSVPVASAVVWVALDAGLDPRRWKAWAGAFSKRVYWLPYFGVSVIVYLGQDFFSPGWWYVPSLSLAILMGLCQQELVGKPALSASAAPVALLVFSLSLCVWNFNRIGWWHWSRLQRQVHQIVKAADPTKIHTLSFYGCTPEQYPDVPLVRVVGDPEAIQNQWRLVHGSSVKVNLRYCERLEIDRREPASFETQQEAIFKWDFPKLEALNPAAKHLAGS